MPYKPTGKPPGRPRKHPLPEPPPAPVIPVHPAAGFPVVPPHGREGAEVKRFGELCALCWPDGWPHQASGLGCSHGSWFRRIP